METAAPPASILIIEDDPGAQAELATLVQALGYLPVCAESGEAGLASFTTLHPALVLLDLRLPGLDGLAVLREIHRRAPETLVIVVSGHAEVGSVVQAMKGGAADFLLKPVGPEEVTLALSTALERPAPAAAPARPGPPAGAVWTGGRFFAHLETLIPQIADTNATVLLQGESGVGKGIVARLLHERSSRRERPFIRVNCAALPLELLESELFGYERGAFTGAVRRKPGKFELAHGGTLLLDEVADLPLPLQAKLLHALQDGEYARLGGEQELKVDVRVIAAANRDLEAAVRRGAFRQDLYYRLNVVSLLLPPLRERREELPALAEHFRARYAREYTRAVPPLSPATLARFAAYAWPGNVRELENLVKRIVLLGSEAFVPAACPLAPPAAPGAPEAPRPPGQGGLKDVARRAAREAERELIRRTLEETRWNRAEAARRLRISYKALLYKIRDCGL
jgi:two-component system, NtrC family, response regulator AtoC